MSSARTALVGRAVLVAVIGCVGCVALAPVLGAGDAVADVARPAVTVAYDEDYEAASLVETELLATFPDDHEISVELTRLPAPSSVPKDRTWAFYRKEALVA